MNTRSTALAALVLSACASGPVPVFWIDARPEDREPYIIGEPLPELGSFDRIDDACAFWGLDCFETDDDRGALTIILSTHGGPSSGGEYHCGETIAIDPCGPLIWTCDAPRVVEHEIGHAFKLSHARSTKNIMQRDSDISGEETTDAQRDRVLAAADRLSRCGGGL
jgi:hypothetical protein